MTLVGLEHLITSDPNTSWGTPVFRGTRVAVQTLFDYLEETSLDDFLRGFPSVSREQAEAVIHALSRKALADFATAA